MAIRKSDLFLLSLAILVALIVVQCSFMPKGLKAFYALPLPKVDRAFYESDGFRMSYVRSGNPQGVPVVFVHGSPGSWEDWKLVIDRPRLKRRFDLIAVNRPGWNEEMEIETVFPDIATQSKMLGPTLDLGHEGNKVILVGHSLGGPVILQMAVDYPEKIAALILLAPSLDPDLDAVRWYNKFADYKLVQFFLPTMLAKSNDEILALPEALRALGEQMIMIDKPVVLVHGQNDELVHPGNADYARSQLVNAPYREVLLQNFGHLIPHFRPAEVVLAIETAANMDDESTRIGDP